jgi:hypothetical protein
MVWAVWQDEQHRAAKRHVAFAALRQVPVGVTVTAGNSSEREQTRRLVQPGGFYVCDRGYVDYELFAQWHALPCSFIVRVQNNAAYEVAHERALSAAARAAGVTSDVVLLRLGTAHHRPCAAQPLRVVRVTTDKRPKDGTPIELVLVTNRLDLDANLIALAYRYRWTVGVSSQGSLTQSVQVRPRPRDSGLVAREAPGRESQPVKPSDNPLTRRVRNAPGCNVQ